MSDISDMYKELFSDDIIEEDLDDNYFNNANKEAETMSKKV